jgi:hypothetical protein
MSALLASGFSIAIHWTYLPHTIGAFVAAAIAVRTFRPYRRWHAGWLSYLVEKTIREMQQKQRSRFFNQLREALRLRSFIHTAQGAIYGFIRGVSQYIRSGFWRGLFAFYMPSAATVLLALFVLWLVLYMPHRPGHLLEALEFWNWPADLPSTTADNAQEGFSHLYEGLIIIVIALIVFVAESIRSSRSADEKRVLLKISFLWPLAVIITVMQFGFLYPPATTLAASATILVAFATIYAFARVLKNLIDPEASALEQRQFLRGRVKDIVMDSARQRVGNKLLFDEFREDGSSGIRATLSKSFIPDGGKNYITIDAMNGGILVDINIEKLKELGRFLQSCVAPAEEPIRQGTADTETISGPSANAPKAKNQAKRIHAYLLRRFREELSEDTVFTNDRALLAVRKDIVISPELLGEIQSRALAAFKFSPSEPSSTAFRREMQSTKDALIAAIKSSSLGEIETLRSTYLLVAEQFIITLNELGGGYTAEQAKEERRSFFSERWNEVRWLMSDVRDLLAVAAQQPNVDVARLIVVLPAIIAIRAFQGGDQLLFQEFTGFATYLYVLGKEKSADAGVGAYFVAKSWEYIKEIFDRYLQISMPTGDDDDE